MLKHLATIALILVSTLSQAATLYWTAPTKNTDNTTIPATGPLSLKGYKIYYNLAGQTSGMMVDIPDKTVQTYTINGLAPGTWNFSLTAYNVAGDESEPTPTVSKTEIGTSPLPPNTSFVTVETTAYNLVKKANGFIILPVGTIPLNTPCDPNQYVNGYNVVPVSLFTPSGTVKPIVVLAKCSAN